MPFALITIGLLVMISAVRNTLPQLASALKNDFSGNNNFFYWIAGIGVVGAIGYIPAARSVSRIFLALLIIVLALHNGGFFSQFMAALQSIQAPPAATTNPATGVTDPSGGSTTVAGSGSTGTTATAGNISTSNGADSLLGAVANPSAQTSGTLGGALSGTFQGLGISPNFSNLGGGGFSALSGF